MDLKDGIQSVCRQATSHRPHRFAVHTLVKATKTPVMGKALEVTVTPPSQYRLHLVESGSGTRTEMPLGTYYALAGLIEATAQSPTTYGNVKAQEVFKLLYDVRTRPIQYIRAGVAATEQVDSAPCMACGLVLPFSHLTIDHQRPQTDGEIEAVLKTFRACGLTREEPKGGKGQQLLAHLRRGVALAPVPTAPGRAALGGTSVDDRYTLNDEGTVLYSFAVAAGMERDLLERCMHGLVNLAPLCQPCNSRRGNPLKF